MDNTMQSLAAERVSAVLKSAMEKQLFDEKDAVVLTGHESKVISDYSLAERQAANSDEAWDDKRFDDFLCRLGVLDTSQAA